VEVLVPDFQGRESSIEIVLSSHPDVLTHNLETVPRLYPTVRPGAVYDSSLDLLRRSAASGLTVKTGLMLGLGETEEELEKVYRDVTEVGCKILTLGQYLQPTWKQLPVARYWRPEEFEEQKARARRIGIPTVAAGPLVRSSYLAGTLLQEATMRISVVGRNFDVNDAVHRYLEERLAKIRRHFDRIMDVSVVLNTEKHRHRAEININVNNVNMRGEEETQDMYTSIDQAVDKIDRQIRRYKDKLNSRKHQHRYTPVNESELPTVTHELLEPNAGEIEEHERRVIKTERHMVKPMSLDEAVMQMDLNNTDFYVFSNANSDKINVIYRRLDGNVGWIVPD
jgi:ribosomal subunit interface protein